MRALLICFAMLPAGTICAQTAAPAPIGSVTGHVVASDTQRPARFATVYLLPKDETLNGDTSSEKKTEESLAMVSVESELDGSFNFQRLPPGDYFALATAPGYIVPVQLPVQTQDKPVMPDLNEALKEVPVVRVVADRSATVDLTIERGASISGVAHYDDGAPVAGLYVQVQPVAGVELPGFGLEQGLKEIVGSERNRTMALDDGSYRLSGLRAGKYLVIGVLSTSRETRTANTGRDAGSEGWQALTVYAPSAFRKSKAQMIEVKAGEQRAGIDLEVALQSLHAVRGKLIAAGSLHPISSAAARLKDGEDYIKYIRVIDGAFHFDYVPSGTYTLTISHANDPSPYVRDSGAKSYTPTYKDAEVTVIVGEHDVVMDDIALETVQQRTGK